jgi:hypothetical protein
MSDVGFRIGRRIRAADSDSEIGLGLGLACGRGLLLLALTCLLLAPGLRAAELELRLMTFVAPPWVRVLRADIEREPSDGRHLSDHYPVTATVALPVVQES